MKAGTKAAIVALATSTLSLITPLASAHAEDPIDEEMCAILIVVHDATGGSVLSVVMISADGDVELIEPIDGELKVMDCPPYDPPPEG